MLTLTGNWKASYRKKRVKPVLASGFWRYLLFFSQIHRVNMKLFLIKIDVVFQTNPAHKSPRARARLSSPQSAGVVFFLFFHFSPFFTSSLSFLLPLPSTAAPERLFLELTWLFKDVQFILCHGFSGRKLLFCFLPPNLLFISFSVSSCCLSKARSLSPTHFLFLVHPCVSLSPLQSHLPPHLHTYVLIPPFLFLSFFYRFLLGKERSFSLSCHHLQHSSSLSEGTFKAENHSLGYTFYIL